MKQYFLFSIAMMCISHSSFATQKIVKETIADSLPTKQTKPDSILVEGRYGWVHLTYKWIPAHKEALAAKNSTKNQVSGQTLDSASTTKPTRIWIVGKREFIHNNYVWVPGHWQNVSPVAK